MTSFTYRLDGALARCASAAFIIALTTACSSSDSSPANATGPVGTAGAGAGGSPPGTGPAPTIPALTETCPDFVDSTITFMGLAGIQIVTGPKPDSPTAPMVFYWHGTGSSSGEFALMAPEVRDGVIAEGGVLVSFQGSTGGDLLSGLSVFGAGDFNVTDQLVACAVRDHNIDPHRIFTTGCSAGGLFADAMAAIRSSYIGAAASNSGGFIGAGPAFDSDHTPALMTIHGARGADKVFIEFTDSSKAADDGFKARGGFVVACDTGGGHCGGRSLAPSIWEFFEAHPYGVAPEPWAGGLPADFPSICQIY